MRDSAGYLRSMNQLGQSASLYLQQHADHPVHWKEWGNEALEGAAANGQWLLVSIGYSTCHWCHVMAHEVFEDAEVASYLNAHFTCIKVDREERTDLDHAYMAASLAMTGQGGWPLNAVCLPDGRPVWTCTYLPKDRFLKALMELAQLKHTHSLRAESYAEEVRSAIAEANSLPSEVRPWDYSAVRQEIPAAWDAFWGGFRGAPKFPLPSTWSSVWRWSGLRSWPEGTAHVVRTVDTLAVSGTYDVIRGGITRYSTDGAWVVPHFEKMLYDSAQFASLCAAVASPLALTCLAETLAFMERDLLRPDGLFAAALDADHPEGEGRHSTWTDTELDAAIGVAHAEVWRAQLLRESRVHEGGWVLAFGPAGGTDPRAMPGFIALRDAGLKRPLPTRDPKCVMAWNALAVIAFADGAQRSGLDSDTERLRKLATAHVHAFADGSTHVHYPDGRTAGPAFLDDVVYSIHMAVRCGQVLLDPEWIRTASKWFARSLALFVRNGTEYYAIETPDAAVFPAPLGWDDDVLPNSRAIWAECGLILGHLLGRQEWVDWAAHMVRQGLEVSRSTPSRHCSWMALSELIGPSVEHWLISPGAPLGPRPMAASPLWGPMERETSVYAQLCRMDACTLVAPTINDFNDGPNPFTAQY
jgi:uncharacterized protein YyaL (SSP411 family)